MLIRRNVPRAFARWHDNFNRTELSGVKKPWAMWGDPRVVYIRSDYKWLVLEAQASGWGSPTSDGGVAYEHQPFTPNWAVEFDLEPGGNQEGKIVGYIDYNWTAGGQASTTRYQAYFSLGRYVDTDSDGNKTTLYQFMILHRDKNSWFPSTKLNFNLTSDEYFTGAIWARKGPNHYKLIFINDTIVVLVFNDVVQAITFVTDPLYKSGPGKRAINFKSEAPFDWYIGKFSTYDREEMPVLPEQWSQIYVDEFNRPNSTGGAGAGWTSGGDNNHGILDNGYSMRQPFPPPGDAYRASWRNPGLTSSNYDLKIEVKIGGGTGDPNTISESVVVARTTAAGLGGIGMFIHSNKARIARINGNIYNSNGNDLPQSFLGPTLSTGNIARGDTVALCIFRDEAWIEVNGNIVNFVVKINTLVPLTADNNYIGLVLRRKAFANSAPFDSVRVSVPAPRSI